jgi:hypothetical protein
VVNSSGALISIKGIVSILSGVYCTGMIKC